VQLPVYTGQSLSGAQNIAQIELNAVEKNSQPHLNAFGAANYSDYKEFLKGQFVKDALGSGGKNMAPGILVQNSSPDGSTDSELVSYGVVTATDGPLGTITVSWVDGPLKNNTQKLGGGDVWSREKFITPEQAAQLGVELDQSVFDDAKAKALAKGKEYIEKQKKAAKLAEENAAKEKAEKEAKAKKDAIKAQFVENGPGFSIQTADLPETDWDYSVDENVPSLSRALKTAQGDDPKKAALGSVALVDSDSIEDLSVRVQKVTGKGGKEQIRVSFVLTDWAGNALTKDLLANDNIAKSNGLDLDMYDQSTMEKQGILVRAKKWLNSKVDTYGTGVTYSGKVGKGTFKLHRAKQGVESPDFFLHGSSSSHSVSFHNKAELFLPADATPADIQKALEDFEGVKSIRAATPQDVKGLIENKMIWLYGSETDGAVNLSGELRQQQLDFIKNSYGFEANDVEIEVDKAGYGRVNFLVPESAAEKISDSTGVTNFLHNWTGDSIHSGTEAQASYLYNVFASGGLYATANRWMNGINSEGMSSKTDLRATGGNYMFTYPKTHNSNGNSGGVSFTFDGKKLLRRMDFYKNNSDKYGQMTGGEENNISKMNTVSGEIMWKGNLSWSDLSGMDLNSDVRKKLIELLTADDNIVPNAPHIVEVLKAGAN